MNKLYAGFGRLDITPPLGIAISGYYKERYAEGVLDPLQTVALALQCGDTKVVLITVDNCGLHKEAADLYRGAAAKATGLPVENIYLHATHTHTGPSVEPARRGEIEQQYYDLLTRKVADVAVLAVQDLKPAKMGWGIGEAPNIAFVRRFRMKDGSCKTNPGVDNPDIVAPIGDVDERVGVLRFDQEGGNSLVLVNFADHPDVVGGNLISGDWPGLLRGTVEKVLDNTRCIMFNGFQGDVNHVNVHPRGGYLNDMFMDFDDVARGYKHAQYMARVVAGGVLQAYDKVKYVEVDSIRTLIRTARIPANLATAEELVEARKINELHEAGRDDLIPYSGMMLTTVVAEAARMLKLENGPEYFDLGLHGLAIGGIVLVGVPGEPFTGIGRALKAAEGWESVFPTCLTDGSQGYFPMKDAYDEGGYEARSSPFKSGVAEKLIDEGLALLDALRK